ncbi:IS3 family transposase [bacterium]|nr:IS3 family transposase [bacterium]
MKKTFSPEQKGRIALQAIKEMKSLSELASKHEAHPNVIGQWKKVVSENAHLLFGDKRKKDDAKRKEREIDELHWIIGKKDTEIEWLKKLSTLTCEEKRGAIQKDHPSLSLSDQVRLLGISRSGLYYAPRENEEDKRMMDTIDSVYTDYPFYGSRRMRHELFDRFGESAGRDRIRRLMREMGIEAIYPKPKTSTPHPEHKKYPYLLRGVTASFPNHIWGTDITYIRLEKGWAYLVAILDWYSRYVLSWGLSLSMETVFCLAALDQALVIAVPNIHNSDQGVQFTDREYVGRLKEKEISISMDGRGRCMDNIFTERLWRTVKYENVYPRSYQDLAEVRD